MITQDRQRKVIFKKVNEMPQKDLENVMTFIQSLENKKSDIETHFASEINSEYFSKWVFRGVLHSGGYFKFI